MKLLFWLLVLVVRVFKHVHGLCNFTNLQMPHNYTKQNYWPYEVVRNKSEFFFEIHSVTNVSFVRIYT